MEKYAPYGIVKVLLNVNNHISDELAVLINFLIRAALQAPPAAASASMHSKLAVIN
jgi:hypothetical protein